ncbi:MAG: CusA/CzcA family heavy metal efflux RND transporter [Flavobacteriales bacterium]|nr:CusA/CzcA family heavy metal efflux RND transporter [Flavobacteriales bacterium]
MLDKIIAFSIKNKLVVGILTTILIIWGIWSASKLPIDAVPDITNNQVQIITVCPTLAGQEVEQLVTYPIERSLTNLPDLEELRSVSRFGLSVVTVVFYDDVDIYFARQLINERLKEAEANIPEGLGTPVLAPVSTGLGEVYQYIIHPKKGAESKYSAMDLRTMQDWIVARQLYGTPGIAEVNSFGGKLKQYEVAVNPDRLLAMGVTLPEIFTSLEKNNENTGGAYIDKKPNAYFIRGLGLIRKFEDIEQIVVKTNDHGIPILIKDVANVQFGSAIRYGAMTYDGRVDAVGGVVMMLKGSNSAEVVRLINEKMPTIQKSLPADVIVEPFLERTDLVNRAISTVEKNLIEGALIVIFVLVLFLGNLRAGLIVASAIPLSMLFALGFMNVFNISANLMSLGAIDFGLIVDGALIIVEATLHHLGLRKSTEKLSQKQMDKEVFVSASKIRGSAAFGEIIILIVYLPILSLTGIEGKMFRPMAETVGLALIGALILSMTYIPMMCALFLPKQSKPKVTLSDRLISGLQKIYLPVLNKVLKYKTMVILSFMSLFGISVYFFSNMGGEFLPVLEEGDYAFHCILPKGTSLSQSIETSMQSMRLIKEFDEVKMVVGKTGSAEVPTDPMTPEDSDMMIILKPRNEWKRKISYSELADEIMKKLEVIPGVFYEINQPIQMRFNELMTGIRQDVAVKIFGENMDTLLHYAEKVNELVKGVAGATEPAVERVDGLPQISIGYNRSQLAINGLNVKDLNKIVSTAFAGGKAGVVFENERKFDLVVRLDSAYRNNMDDIRHLPVPTKDGSQIPLSQVADIKMDYGPAQISRESGMRRIVVGFNIKNRDVASVVDDIQTLLEERVQLPEGYYYTYGGTFENLQAASRRLSFVLPIALLLILILLFFTFNSLSQAILIFSAIPMSAIGGVFALMIRDMPFSISAGIGFIALFGVSVLNGIVLISTFNTLEKEGMTDLYDRIREGTRIRLRPVLLTATVASLGFLPMALSQSAGAEVQRPLATVVIGGLFTATFLTLFVLPLFYVWFSKFRKGVKPALLFLLFLPFTQAEAQNESIVDAEKAVEIAIKNNPLLKSGRMEKEASGVMTKTSLQLPKTNVTYQYGQYNSYFNDKAIQVSQNIPFPSYFAARSGILKEQFKQKGTQAEVLENDLKLEVLGLYYKYQNLILISKRWQFMDSISDLFYKAASLRYETGETGLLEKKIAENQKEKITLQKIKVLNELNETFFSLKTVMNVTEDFQITKGSENPIRLKGNWDTLSVRDHPEMKIALQEINLQKQQIMLARAEAFPEFNLGYFNQSLTGFQNINGKEEYYGPGKRFQGVNIGLSIPLSLRSSKANLVSAGLRKQAAEQFADHIELHLRSELNKALNTYKSKLKTFQYYQTTALPNSEVMHKTAQLGYSSGEIDYMQYILALETIAEIQIEYVKSIYELNRSILQIHYLKNTL